VPSLGGNCLKKQRNRDKIVEKTTPPTILAW
jgi:hypothetical protein